MKNFKSLFKIKDNKASKDSKDENRSGKEIQNKKEIIDNPFHQEKLKINHCVETFEGRIKSLEEHIIEQKKDIKKDIDRKKDNLRQMCENNKKAIEGISNKITEAYEVEPRIDNLPISVFLEATARF